MLIIFLEPFFWNSLLCLGQSHSCFLSVESVENREADLSVAGSQTCEVIGVVTQSPVQAKVNEQKKLRSLYRKEGSKRPGDLRKGNQRVREDDC